MNRFRYLAGFAVTLLVCSASNAAVWQCNARNLYKLTDGSIEKNNDKPFAIDPREPQSLLYDESSGVVRHLRNGQTTWTLTFKPWQIGSDANSAVAIYTRQGPAANPVMLLRISSFRQGEPMTAKSFFFADEFGAMLTGTCARLADR